MNDNSAVKVAGVVVTLAAALAAVPAILAIAPTPVNAPDSVNIARFLGASAPAIIESVMFACAAFLLGRASRLLRAAPLFLVAAVLWIVHALFLVFVLLSRFRLLGPLLPTSVRLSITVPLVSLAVVLFAVGLLRSGLARPWLAWAVMAAQVLSVVTITAASPGRSPLLGLVGLAVYVPVWVILGVVLIRRGEGVPRAMAAA